MLFRTDFISPATAFERSRPRRTLRVLCSSPPLTLQRERASGKALAFARTLQIADDSRTGPVIPADAR
jgi:hypothetical protein